MKIPSLAGSDSSGFLRFKGSVCLRFCAFALLAILTFAPGILAQTATRSVGWVVISVDEYRSLRARAFPSDRESPSPPVDATLTRADYDLRISGQGEIAAGRATLTDDVLKDELVRVPAPPALLVLKAPLASKIDSLVEVPSAKV